MKNLNIERKEKSRKHSTQKRFGFYALFIMLFIALIAACPMPEPTPEPEPVAEPTAPGTMAAPTLEPGNRHLLVTWSAPADNGGSAITAYHLRHSTDGGTNWSEIITLAAPAASYPIRGLRNSTSYEVQARAVNNTGAGNWSEIATETPLVVKAHQIPEGTAASISLSAANTAIIARENPTVSVTTVEPGTLVVNEMSGAITVTPVTLPDGDTRTPPAVNASTGVITVTANTTAGTYLVYGENGGNVLFAEYFYVTVSPQNKTELEAAVTAGISTWGDTADLNYIITTAVTDMSLMFKDKSTFNGDVSRWDTGRVTNIKKMFWNASEFNGDISLWNTTAVTNMSDLFRNATVFNSDISGWDVSSVRNMSYMFKSATVFNSDISRWDTGRVTDLSYMFLEATAFNSDISGWDVSSVMNMTIMFADASAFNQDLTDWAWDNSMDPPVYWNNDNWTNGTYNGPKSNMFLKSGLDTGNPTDPETAVTQPHYPSWYWEVP